MAEKYIVRNYGPSRLSSIQNKINSDLKKVFKSVINSKLLIIKRLQNMSSHRVTTFADAIREGIIQSLKKFPNMF